MAPPPSSWKALGDCKAQFYDVKGISLLWLWMASKLTNAVYPCLWKPHNEFLHGRNS